MAGSRQAPQAALAAALLVRLGCCKEGTSRVLFGSCNKAEWEQPLWPHVLARQPDVWIWGGDNIYGDHVEPSWPKSHFAPADAPRLRRLYHKQLQVPGYQRLLNSQALLLATWDDHDMGLNDGDCTYPHRNSSQAAFLDFIGEPADSPRRRQRGVWAARRVDFGSADRSVLVVLLDMRYHRDPYGTPDGDFLGEEQWRWLDETLAQSTAAVHVIVSSVQFLPDRSGLGENWFRFPGARSRMLRLLARHNVSAPIIISGDVHFAEFNMGTCTGGQLLEVTSSGMTHSVGTRDPSQDTFFKRMELRTGMLLGQSFIPWRYQMLEPYTGAQQYYTGLNFGELEFKWDERAVAVKILGEDGLPHMQRAFSLDSLGVGGAGEAGVLDFGPLRGEPSVWRVKLGFALALATPLLVMLSLLVCIGISIRRLVASLLDRAPGKFEPESESESEHDSGLESNEQGRMMTPLRPGSHS